MAPVKRKSKRKPRRLYPDDFKQEAVQLLLDGYTASSVAERLGVSDVNLLYRWKQQAIGRGGPAAQSLDDRVRQLEDELHRVERERDILKKALAILEGVC